MKYVYIIAVMSLFFFAGCSGQDNVTGDAVSDTGLEGDPDKVTVYFFWGETCPHCSKEKPFLEDLDEKYPGMEVKMFETYNDPENVPLFKEAAAAHGIQARGVPATFIGEEHWLGFSERIKGDIEDYVRKCIDEGCEDLIAE